MLDRIYFLDHGWIQFSWSYIESFKAKDHSDHVESF